MIGIPLETARVADADILRPGYWWQPRLACSGDGRELTQEHTDVAIALGIAREICRRTLEDGAWQDAKREFELDAALWLEQPAQSRLLLRNEHQVHENTYAVNDQRGGIHTDPIVRTYARHLWGDRDAAWNDQPICACGHEAGLHITMDSTLPNMTYCVGCPATVHNVTGTCRSSEARVRELAGPMCTCPTPWNAEAPGRFVRTNCGGSAVHSELQCQKGAWWRTIKRAESDANFVRAGILTPDEIRRSRFS